MAYNARCSARCVPAFIAPASLDFRGGAQRRGIVNSHFVVRGLVRIRGDFRGADRGGPLVAGAVLHVGQRVGRLRAHRLVVRRLEVRHRFVQLVGRAPSGFGVGARGLLAGGAERRESKFAVSPGRRFGGRVQREMRSATRPCLVR